MVFTCRGVLLRGDAIAKGVDLAGRKEEAKGERSGLESSVLDTLTECPVFMRAAMGASLATPTRDYATIAMHVPKVDSPLRRA